MVILSTWAYQIFSQINVYYIEDLSLASEPNRESSVFAPNSKIKVW